MPQATVRSSIRQSQSWRSSALAAALFAMVAVALPAGAGLPSGEAAAQQQDPGPCPLAGVTDRSIDGFLTHDELRDRLERLPRQTQGRVKVDLIGHSHQGREIWSATVGHGDKVILAQSEIHGNEKHGTRALLTVLRQLANNSQASQLIREQVTFVAIPKMNPDGGELNRRQNDMPWDDVVELYPQLAGAPRSVYYSNFAGGFDLNRDYTPYMDYEPDPADLPGSATVPPGGLWITPEARAVREVYRQLEAEHGIVDVFADLHNQGACSLRTYPDGRHWTTISITAGLNDPPPPEFPHWDWDASRRANVIVAQAIEQLDPPFNRPSIYRLSQTTWGSSTVMAGARGSARVLFEVSGQTQQIGDFEQGSLERQIVVGLLALADHLANDTFDDIDPELYSLIAP